MPDSPTDTATDPAAEPPPSARPSAPRFRWRLHRHLPLLVLGFGLLWVFLIPPFQLPDEPNHVFRSYVLSEGRVFGWHYDHDEQGQMNTGYLLPSDFSWAMLALRFDEVRWHPDKPFAMHCWRDAAEYRVNDGEPTFQGFSNTCIYPPSAYPLGIAGWWGLRAVNAPVVVAMVVQRLLPLLATVACLAFVLRRLPMLRQPYALILLAPISVQQAISPGADLVVNIGCLIFLTELIRLLTIQRHRRVPWSSIVIMAVCAVFFVSSKLVYVPVALMALSLTPRRFGGVARWLGGMALILVVPLALLIAWSAALSGHPTTMTEDIAHHRASYDTVYWLQMAIKNVHYNLVRWEFYQSWYGRMGWLDTQPPAITVVLYLAAMIAVIILQPVRRRMLLPPWHALGWAACIVAMLGLIFLASVGYSNNLLMVQVRYYLPLVLPVLLLLHQVRARFGWGLRQRLRDGHILGIAFLGLATMTWVLATRYY